MYLSTYAGRQTDELELVLLLRGSSNRIKSDIVARKRS
jgi:hypothetical protein